MPFNLLRDIFVKNQQKEHRSILTESVPKAAPIELPDSAFESADVSKQNSQQQRVSISLTSAFSMAKLLKSSKTPKASRSLCEL